MDEADSESEAEGFYVAARILEATAKSGSDAEDDDSTVRATVYARAAERAKKGEAVERVLDALGDSLSEDEARAGAEAAVERLRLAAEEVEADGRARIVEEVDETVVARLRSEYD